MRKKDLYRQLVERYLNRTASTEELQTFFHLLEQGKLKKQLLEATRESHEPVLYNRPGLSAGKLRHMGRRYGVAAAVLVGLLGVGILFLSRARPRRDETPVFVSVFNNDIDPGRDRAVLTLTDGAQVNLDRPEDYDRLQEEGDNGQEGGDSRQEEGNRRQEGGPTGHTDEQRVQRERRPLYRSLSTPAGGQYRLTLVDGTKVWLNSKSSIRFPTVFYGKVRSVEVSGEAYFDVAKDARRPFVVKAGNLTVQALGTQFNIHAYPDESSAKATLIQGSVRVINGDDSLLLIPGQEGETNGSAGLAGNNDVDTSQTAAWKEGYFDFDNLDIQAIMRQFARWYDIQVVFAGKPSTAPFAGRMQRSLRLSQVMTGLGRTGIHSRLEGRVLTILP